MNKSKVEGIDCVKDLKQKRHWQATKSEMSVSVGQDEKGRSLEEIEGVSQGHIVMAGSHCKGYWC